MAVTSIWRIKGAIGKVVLYVQNEDKTMSKETIESDKKLLEESEVLDAVFDYVTRDKGASQSILLCGAPFLIYNLLMLCKNCNSQ